ncbi:peptidoglycan D,D-transpeptidase FtsI family protein [Alicyclobacillus fastidiosus]|uniref:peptidoglycan D,D-transpeptidase FtsI family protein n=1 Tax=Alicyclobacillus fastidiosus TaxID=392011 RepID=UPI0023E974C7|nr:penicillin-binding transpeptidase domain-containing protein [Alicyclobacillus fastidiosus]GMA64883.1 penicillin-binding protein [Alicyclobacillus fastidiosus]
MRKKPREQTGKKSSRKILRINVVYSIIFLSFTGLILRAAYVEVAKGPAFRSEETSTQFTKMPLLPQRGWIYDANGQVLAWDTPSDGIELDNSTGNTDTEYHDVANKLAPILNETPQKLYNTIIANKSSLQIPLATHITDAQIAYVVEHQSELPNVEVDQTYNRQYPYGDLAGQVLGYVGSITAQNVGYYSKKGYIDSQKVGVGGLEEQYESLLQGKPGTELLTVNPSTNTVEQVGAAPPAIPGDNIQLTLDGRTQAEAQMILKNLIDSSSSNSTIAEGSAVMLNVKTGGVLAMVSYPYLNPNWYSSGTDLTASQIKYLTTSGAQENYAIDAPEYPGSTVKPANLIAAMKHGVVTPNTTVDDNGYIRIGQSIIHEDEGMALGLLNPIEAVAVSSDVFFYEVGLDLGKWFGSSSTSGGSYPSSDGSYQNYLDTDFAKGINTLFQGEWDFGLGPKTGIDLPGEVGGNFYIEDSDKGYEEVPYNLQQSEASIKKTGKYVNHGTPEDLAFAGIGQSQQFTTMQLATYAMNLANNGKKLKPHLLSKVYSATGGPNSNSTPLETVNTKVEGQVQASPAIYQLVKTAMNDVTTGAQGGPMQRHMAYLAHHPTR